MSLRLTKESQLTKSTVEYSENRKDPGFQSWINKGGPGLSSQSQHSKSDKKLPPHPDFVLKTGEPIKVRNIVITVYQCNSVAHSDTIIKFKLVNAVIRLRYRHT